MPIKHLKNNAKDFRGKLDNYKENLLENITLRNR